MTKRSNVKSNALETQVSLARDGWPAVAGQMMTRYGLVIILVLLTVLFSLTAPEFYSILTVQAILSTQTIIAILALAAVLPMIVGKIDLNVGFGIVLWHILAVSLQVDHHLSWPAASPDWTSRVTSAPRASLPWWLGAMATILMT